MILKTTTNEFCFINVSFYETVADPRHFFGQDYEEMPEYEEESDFDFDSYCNKFIPFVQEWANKEIIERKSDSGYDVTILLNMYLTLAFVKEFGFKA